MKDNPLNDFERVFQEIAEVQGEWNGSCTCKECYWNMWHPTKRPDQKTCVSESLADTKMEPNTTDCPSYWSFVDACGVAKG